MRNMVDQNDVRPANHNTACTDVCAQLCTCRDDNSYFYLLSSFAEIL